MNNIWVVDALKLFEFTGSFDLYTFTFSSTHLHIIIKK